MKNHRRRLVATSLREEISGADIIALRVEVEATENARREYAVTPAQLT